ncbi:MAG: hypothetical protein H0T85_06665 [Geodermatophilaceae bacterium]|nr:hypothetical protein [Geodermatophilaceae bacterium]
MTALAYRTRVDEAVGGRFQTKLTNTGTESFTVVSTGLDSAGFAPLPQSERSTMFRPGARIDLPTPYGEVRCRSDQPAEPAYAVVDVVRPDGSRQRLRVPMPSDYGVLTRIHEQGCVARQLAEDVTVELSQLATTGDGAQQVVRGVLRLTRGETPAEIAVTEVRGSVLYELAPRAGTTLPQALVPGETTLDIPLEVSPASCEAHIIAETKKPFVFPVFLALDGGEPVFSLIPVSDAQRELLYDSLIVTCGL